MNISSERQVSPSTLYLLKYIKVQQVCIITMLDLKMGMVRFSSVQFSHSAVSDSL